MKKVLLKGYFTKNLGDDLFFYILAKKYQNIEFISYSDMSYKKKSLGLNLKINYNFLSKVLNKIIRILTFEKKNIISFSKKKYDMMVLIGGSIFYEEVPTNKLRDFINRDFFSPYINYCIIGSNLSSKKSKYYNNQITTIIKNAQDVCFRDLYSFSKFSSLSNVRYAPDVVFSLDTREYVITNKKSVLISVINPISKGKSKKNYDCYKNLIQRFIKEYINKGYSIILMSFCAFEGDEKIINDIYDSCPDYSKNISKFFYDGNITEALNVIANSEVIVASRFHANVLGFVFNKKVIPIIYADKTYNLLKDIEYNGKIYDIRYGYDNIEKQMTGKLDYIKNVNKFRKKSNDQFNYLDKIFK